MADVILVDVSARTDPGERPIVEAEWRNGLVPMRAQIHSLVELELVERLAMQMGCEFKISQWAELVLSRREES